MVVYDVIDFYQVDPRFGTNTTLVELATQVHQKGMHIVLDLVVGVEHVCIGTDTKMATPKNANDRFGKNTNQSWKSKDGFFYTVVDAMLKSGFTKNEIIKIGGGNYCRIFDKTTIV